MENFGVSLNKVKQPQPDVLASENSPKRLIKNPYVGIISNINPTSTPLSDTLTLKGQEIPHEKQKAVIINKSGIFTLNNVLSGGIIACGIAAIISLFKK